MTNEKFLHGGLHQDNILQRGNEWTIIDPKGVVGEIEFEAAAREKQLKGL
jgi:streptomycin 6-kinase